MEKKVKNLHILILLAITALAFFLRFYRLRDYMLFLGDQGRDVLVVKKMLVDGKFTLLGPVASVGGFYLGPIYYYFIAPFLLISGFDPIGPAFFPAILGSLTPLILFFYLKSRFSIKTALIAGFLYAVSPVLVKYNRFSWNPNVVPFFSLLFFIAWEKYISSQKKLFAFLTGVIIGILFQLHYLAFIFAPVIGLMAIIKYKTNWRKIIQVFVTCVFGLIIGWLPFIVYEVRHNMQNFSGLVEFISRQDGTNVGFDATRYFKTVFANSNLILYYLFNLPTSISYIFLIIMIGYIVKNHKQILSQFVIFSILVLSLYKGKMGEHYYNIIYALFLIITADILSRLLSKKFWFVGITSLIIIFCFSIKAYPFWQEPNHQLDQTIEISKHILNRYTKEKPFNFALVTQTNSDYAYRYFFDLWKNPPVEILNDVIDPQRKTVTDKLIVLCEPLSSCPDPRGNGLWEIASFGRAEIVSKETHGVYIIYELKHWIDPKKA